ncbi:MAG: NTP transferase domain-containing protein [Bacteroidetes bacterium]|nr:NTP transferase domain-containing protein [Bacteroidota bacterium]
MKAIIPVAGIGTRLKPHTHTQPKALVPVAGKPILSFIIDGLVKAGIKDFVFIIGYLGEEIKEYVEKKYPKIHSEFVVQVNRHGIGHAIWTARKHIRKNEEIFIVLGDTIFEVDLKKVFKMPYSALGVKKVEDPRGFGVAEISNGSDIDHVVEKPNIPRSNSALVGLYKIKESAELITALDYLIKKDIRTKNEIQLTDAIQRMIEKGIKFKSFSIDNWYDCGKKQILLETNAILLKKTGFASKKIPFFENTIIIHPVNIGGGCKITNSIIGPNVSLGEKVNIDRSIIKESIIGPYSQITHGILHNSVIGNEAVIKGVSQSLNIGNSTEIDFS